MNRSALTNLLTLASVVWLERRGGAVYTEARIHDLDDSLRLDVVLVGCKRSPATIGIEVKSCRADFTADAKLWRYLGRVNELWVATMPGEIAAHELPEGCGLLELNLDWPTVHGQPRTIANIADWQDVLIQRQAAASLRVPVEAEVDLLRGLALSSRRVDGRAVPRRHSLEDELAMLRSRHAAA
jgi:hypothetical protein